MQSRGSGLLPPAVRFALGGVSLWLLALLSACHAPKRAHTGQAGEPGQLPGIDTSQLTAVETRDWWVYVSELPAPCPPQGLSIAQCVAEARPCPSCAPAAELLLKEVKLGKARPQVEGAFRTRFAPERVKSLDLAGAPSKGPEQAPVVIAEWADFECPYCQRAAATLDFAHLAYPDQVRVVFKHFPIAYHPNAERAARAAIAAQRQDKFWRLHDLMYGHADQLDEDGIVRLAQRAGLDLERFRADMESEAARATIARDRQQADALGLTGTPMVFVNGRYFDFAYFSLEEDLDDWIRLEIELVTGKTVAPLPVDQSQWPRDPEP